MEPEASPATIQVGPTLGVTEPPVGSFPPVTGPSAVSAESPQYEGATSTNVSINLLVFMSFQPEKVDSSPTPTFTRPSPRGKIQP
ncbi:unannotated protein [freshwater metagenome]|uniref:Unannotated protein n=1 Tax=freshwater metagenome TaxID=449393 RepID=A0A6J7QI87_9ZZZZ